MASRLIFLFSLPRSGSTLLQRILAGHPDIQTTSELWFLLPFIYTLKTRGVYAQYSHVSLSNAISDLLKQLPDGKQDYYDSLRLFADTIYEKISLQNSSYFLDKTPRYYLIINEIEKIYPDAKFIFLFRNPLSTLSSMITSFNGGRLGDQRHRIDLYKGPFMLSKGFEALREKSISIQYEKLLTESEETIKLICEYLNVPYYPSLIEDINMVSLRGKMGDSIGTREYQKIEEAPIVKWKEVIDTRYRRSYAFRYVNYLGEETLSTFGYRIDDILSDLKRHNVKTTIGMRDRYDLFSCFLKTLFEIPMLKKKIKDILRFDNEFYNHY